MKTQRTLRVPWLLTPALCPLYQKQKDKRQCNGKNKQWESELWCYALTWIQSFFHLTTEENLMSSFAAPLRSLKILHLMWHLQRLSDTEVKTCQLFYIFQCIKTLKDSLEWLKTSTETKKDEEKAQGGRTKNWKYSLKLHPSCLDGSQQSFMYINGNETRHVRKIIGNAIYNLHLDELIFIWFWYCDQACGN